MHHLSTISEKGKLFGFPFVGHTIHITDMDATKIFDFSSSYYKVVVFIDPLQGLYAILLEILWIVFRLLPLDGL